MDKKEIKSEIRTSVIYLLIAAILSCTLGSYPNIVKNLSFILQRLSEIYIIIGILGVLSICIEKKWVVSAYKNSLQLLAVIHASLLIWSIININDTYSSYKPCSKAKSDTCYVKEILEIVFYGISIALSILAINFNISLYFTVQTLIIYQKSLINHDTLLAPYQEKA